MLSLSRRDDAGTILITAVGDLDLSTTDDFEREVTEAVATRTGDVVVDLSGLTFIDSAGINALLKGRRAAEEHGRAFRVGAASGLVREVLEMTGVWPYLSQTS